MGGKGIAEIYNGIERDFWGFLGYELLIIHSWESV
jgi:hypothetical protein